MVANFKIPLQLIEQIDKKIKKNIEDLNNTIN